MRRNASDIHCCRFAVPRRTERAIFLSNLPVLLTHSPTRYILGSLCSHRHFFSLLNAYAFRQNEGTNKISMEYISKRPKSMHPMSVHLAISVK